MLAALALGFWLQTPSADAFSMPTLADHDARCRTFKHPVTDDRVLDTEDRTSEVGTWVGGLRDKGWALADLDFELTRKDNGLPMGFVQICMVKAR